MFISPALLLFAFVVLIPVLMTFVFSFYDWNGIGQMKFTGFDNYIRAFQDRIYINSYGHTLIYIVATVVVEVLVGLGLAGLITMGRKGSGIFRLAFFVPVMLPMIVVSYLWKFVYNSDFGLINILLEKIGLESWTRVWLGNPDTALYAICIVSGWVYAGFYMTIFYSGIQRISKEVYESAYLDGAGEGQIFFKIKVPMIRNLVETGVMLCVLTGFQSFDLFYVMTNGGPYNSTEIVTTYLVKVVFTHMSIGYGSALAVIMTIVIAVIGLVAGRLNKKDSGVLEY
ncbi:sugar ABC transporter permease [Paenibacillus sp. FSL P4-0081]|nr:sugar ABC transporter permease [Paenibacillus sp. FSL P4-0081]